MEIRFTPDPTKPAKHGEPLTVGDLLDTLSKFDRNFTLMVQPAAGPCEFAKSIRVAETKVAGVTVYGVVVRATGMEK